MPANLPPQYYEEEKKLRKARTPEEKVAILEALLSMIPKHKGTEKLQGDLKRRLSRARDQQGRKGGGARRGSEHHVPKEGAGQIVLVGLPNVGKSQIVGALTKASPQIAGYPYATLKPVAGMARFENVLIQLVDLPPLMWEATDRWVYNLVRNADAVCLVADLTDDPAGQAEILLEEMAERGIQGRGRPQPGQSGEERTRIKTVFLAGSKLDLPGGSEGLRELGAALGDGFPVVGISAREGTGTDAFLRAAFEALARVRVYTKAAGKTPDLSSPFVFRQGTTVQDMAREIHKDLAGRLRAARIFCDDKYDGQRVGKDFVLRDGDVIELLV